MEKIKEIPKERTEPIIILSPKDKELHKQYVKLGQGGEQIEKERRKLEKDILISIEFSGINLQNRTDGFPSQLLIYYWSKMCPSCNRQGKCDEDKTKTCPSYQKAYNHYNRIGEFNPKD